MADKKIDIKKELKEIAETLLNKLEIDAKVSVSSEGEKEDETFTVTIESENEAGLMIGAHGSTLAAIQSFFAMALRQKTGEWTRVVVDIGDWRQKHEDHLSALAHQAAERARQTGEPQHLYNLTPSQRRVIHMALTKEKDVESESEGEGEGRYLVVKSK